MLPSSGARITLCGPLTARLGDRDVAAGLGRGQLRLLFGYLVLHRDRTVTRDELAAAIWPDHAPAAYRAGLAALLSKLRAVVRPEATVEGRAELRLVVPEPAWIDVEQARRETAAATAALAGGAPSEAIAAARRARDAAAYELLPGHDAPWLEAARRDLEDVRRHALACSAQAGLTVGGHELASAERAARELIASDPYRETAYGTLIEILEASGDVAAALRVYAQIQTLLRDELGTLPGAVLRHHHARLLAGAASPEPRPLPAGLRSTRPFVGRDRLLDRLQTAWDAAAAGTAQIVLLAGEAGVGKSSLSAELAARLHADGAAVLYGRCDEDAVMPYQPFVEALGDHAANVAPARLRAQLGGGGGELARIVPRLRSVVGDLPAPLRGQPATERLRLFEETTALLAAAAREEPLLLVLDDVHWADQAPLLLLRHLARARLDAPLLVLATYRTTELQLAGPLARLVDELGRDQLGQRLTLDGLDVDEVGRLIALSTGHAAPPPLVRAVRSETAGNPFFVGELVRHLDERGVLADDETRWAAGLRLEDIGLPDGVRTAVDRRLAGLGDGAARVLRHASVLGHEFDVATAARTIGIEEDRVLDALETAVAAHLLSEVRGAVGRFSYPHALVRTALYDGLGATRRARLHGRAGAAIEAIHGDDLDPHLSELANHFARATGPAATAKSVDYATRAARRALSQYAYEEAAALLGRGLDTLAAAGAPDRQTGRLLLDLGRAQTRMGDVATARRTFRRAAELAKTIGDADLLARAALGYAGPWLELGAVDDVRLSLLEQALDALGDEDGPLRAGLLSRLALEVYYTGAERRDALSREAVEVARRLGDGVATARALMSRRVALAGSPDLAERLDVTSELLRLALGGGATETALWGYIWRSVDLLERGDAAGAYADFAAYAALAEELRQDAYRWPVPLFAAMRAQLEGRFAEADALAAEAVRIGARAHDPNAANYAGILVFVLRCFQGRLAEAETVAHRASERFSAVPAWRCGLALVHAAGGRHDEARATVAAFADDAARLPVDINWLPAMAWLAFACGLIADERAAPALYRVLAPHAQRTVTTGHPIFCIGPVTHYLGILAATAGRLDAACAHFEDALARNAALDAAPLLAQTRHEYARALLRRGRPADRARGHALLAQARETADALGMGLLRRRVRAPA